MKRYPGLGNFQESDSLVFCGREKETQSLFDLIEREKVILIYGKSGIGKSSLLNAGVFPKLQTNSYLRFTFSFKFFTANEGNRSLKEVFISQIEETLKTKELNDLNIWKCLKKHEIKLDKTLIFVFDQFEELFLFSNNEIIEFATLLNELQSDYPPVTVINEFKDVMNEELREILTPLRIKFVFSIRSDKINELYRIKDYLPTIHKNEFHVKTLTKGQAIDALVEPSSREKEINLYESFDSEKYDISTDLIDRILNKITTRQQDTGEDEISTVQLQIIASEIEKIVINEKLTIVTLSNFSQDKINNSIKMFYHEQLSTDNFSEGVDVVKQILENRFVYEGNKVPIIKKQADSFFTLETIEILIKNRILKEDVSSSTYYYELSHDTLIEPIEEDKNERRLLDNKTKALKDELKRKELNFKAEIEKKNQAIEKRNKIVITSIAITLISIVSALAFYFYSKNEAETEKKEQLSKLEKYDIYDALRNFNNRNFKKANMYFLKIKNNEDFQKKLDINADQAEKMIKNTQDGIDAEQLLLNGKYTLALAKYAMIQRNIPKRFIQIYPLLNDFYIKIVKDFEHTKGIYMHLNSLLSLKKLKLVNKALAYIPLGINGGNFSTVETIDASGNKFNGIPLAPLKLKSLKEYNLSTNNISELDSNLYFNKTINTLGLNSNKMQVVPSGIFKMNNLVALNLKGNEITIIENFNINKNSTLNSIVLSQNPLGKFPSILVNNLPKLKDLHLRSCYLEELPPVIFFEKSLLSKVDLAGNKIDRDTKKKYKNIKNRLGEKIIFVF